MDIVISSLIGYLIGSIPSAYLLIKHKNGLDIRNLGTGNVGTLNSYEVTNSKHIGIAVLFFDLIKGILSVLLAKYFIEDTFKIAIISLNFAVLGHCYSIWLKFKGGRGLATAAGGSLLLAPSILFIWLAAWILIYQIRKNIHLANIFATIVVIFFTLLFNVFLSSTLFPPPESNFVFGISVSLLMLIILSKHWIPFLEIIRKN